MAESHHEAAKALLREAKAFPGVSVVDREALEEEISSMPARYLTDTERHTLARFSYRQLARLKKGRLMLSDREIVEALLRLKKAPSEC